MATFLTPKILKALEFAALSHEGQSRLGQVPSPYISHPFAVGLILSQAGFSEEVIIAGIFHDLIEDTSVQFEDIEENFGKPIARLVAGVTEDISLSFLERKEKYLQHLREGSSEVAAISAADLFANRLSMLNELKQGTDLWKNFTWGPEATFAYDRKRIAVIQNKLDNPLVSELALLVDELEQLTNFG